MNRRTAIQLLFVGMAGMLLKKTAVADTNLFEESLTKDEYKIDYSIISPMDVVLDEAGLNELVIERKSGKTIRIPFKEIFDALET